MKKHRSPDERVQRLHDAGLRDGRVQRAVFQALVTRGGRIDTWLACAEVYPDHAVAGRKVNWRRLRNVRRALERIATPIGRSTNTPGKPIIWRSKLLQQRKD